MSIRKIVLATLCASIALGSATPSFAGDGWRHHERREWREHAWGEHSWRGHDWREHAWRDRAWRRQEWREHQWRHYYRAPPVVVGPRFGYYAPPAFRFGGPGYYYR